MKHGFGFFKDMAAVMFVLHIMEKVIE